MNIALGVLAGVLIIWSIYGYFGSRVEQAEYTVITKTDTYEVRNYPAHIVAETTVQGDYQESMSSGFRIVAGYIFGGNIKKESIAMTAPVMTQGSVSEKIAMTSPVMVSSASDTRTISFGMPKSYTLETLPTPTDARVQLVEVPEKKYAVMRFSGYRTDSRIAKIETELLTQLTANNVEALSTPLYAGYNAPWTPPWMTRNEVLVEVK